MDTFKILIKMLKTHEMYRPTNVLLQQKIIIFILFQDAAKQCKAYMARDPDNINFTVIALAANDS